MEYRTLGRTGHKVSLLGVGGHTYPVGHDKTDHATPGQRAELISYLVENGVNYFDTTWTNEVELLADSFKRAELGEDCLVSMQYVDGTSKPDLREKLRGEVETRLEIMGWSSAPLFIMGIGNDNIPYSEMVAAVEALNRLKEEGLIGHLGFSCHRLEFFSSLAKLIRETDLVDYTMIRYNWKFPQASEDLFAAIREHRVGLVLMKVFCWDCGPDAWDRRISLFEPLNTEERETLNGELNAAQRSLLWALQTSPASTSVPSINAMWEAKQNLAAIEQIDTPADTCGFERYAGRLDRQEDLALLAKQAESHAIRQRAAALL